MGRLKTFCGRFWVQVGAVCLVAVLAVVARQLLLPAHGPRAQISPFFSLAQFHFGWYTFVPPLAFAAFIVPLRWALRRPPASKLFYLAVAFFAFTTTVNMAGGGPIKVLPGALWQYAFDAQKLYTHGNFLRDYHLHVAGMHWHTTVHPPGVFLYLYPLLKLFGNVWIPVALVNALLAGAGVVFVYKAAELVYGVDAGDAAAALYVTTPSLILYGSTVDAVLCALGAAVVFLLALYLSRGRLVHGVLTGLALAAGTFAAYQFAFIWVLVVVWS
ncbi:MAG: glycosyltransferase family 39 protein, partial [bacterium]